MHLFPALARAGGIVVALVLSCASVAAEDLNAVLARTNQLIAAGNYDAALAQALKLEAGIKAQFGVNHPNYVIALNQLLRIYAGLGRYGEAESAASRALAIRQKALPPSDPTVAQSQDNLAAIYKLEGKYKQAESLFREALATETKALGPDNPNLSINLNNLGVVLEAEGKHAEAEQLLQRALALREKALGAQDPAVAETLSNVAIVYLSEAKYSQAETAFNRALEIQQKALGPAHPAVAATLNNLAEVERAQAKDDTAEALYQHALAIYEKAFGPQHPSVALALRNLAELHREEGDYAAAEGMFQRALAINEKALGPAHPETAATLNNFAGLYMFEHKYAEAETLYRRGLDAWQKAFGADNPDTANFVQNLGFVAEAEGKHAEAETGFRRALAIREKALGPDNPAVAESLAGLATSQAAEGKLADAKAAYLRALAIEQAALGATHPTVAQLLLNLALINDLPGGNPAEALAYARKATAAELAHGDELAAGGGSNVAPGAGVESRADFFRIHVANLALAARNGDEPALGREAFEMAQWASQSSAAAAVQQMAARFAGTGALGALVRERQDLSAAWNDASRGLVDAEARPQSLQDSAALAAARQQLADLEGKLAANAARLAQQFPDYAALTSPKPLRLEDAQQVLEPGEAMVFLLSGEEESYVFALTRDRFDWKVIPLGGGALQDKVAAFRHGLDVAALDSSLRSGKPDLFDLDLANALYATLLGPVDALVRDSKQLIIVPSGALTSLPFHLLVTDKPAAAKPANPAGYRDAAWLIKRQAVSVLPSVASLKALRQSGNKSPANARPLIGFADPVFDPAAPAPSSDPTRGAARGELTASYTDFWRGAEVDRSALSKALPQLPDTATEVKAVAQKLGAPASDVHLGRDASETVLKAAPLADYRIVYFATHGLVAGDIKGLGEPSLVLSIPAKPTAADDGVLTASEVAQLKLNADWVVLSACNTIAGGKPGAEALSGLARAFFYAGARAVLVSHWAVDSEAATRLTTSTFDLLVKKPELGRAEALRQAMLAYLNDASDPNAAYPAYWGPFAIIGEGAVGR